jgi:integrase/recombinase XerD
MKVHLRQRKQTKNGSISLYLEFYKGTTITSDGKVKILRKYEYLELYLFEKPKSQAERQHNKDTLQLAENIKAKRQLEIKNGQHGFSSGFKQNVNFMDYFCKMTDSKFESDGNHGNWQSTKKHLMKYAGSNILFKDIDVNFCEGFRDYLVSKAKTSAGQPLSSSSIASYYNKFRSSLKQANKKGIISYNPATEVKLPKVIEKERNYLSFEELQKIAKAECRYEVLKRAFLFSCYTGIAWADLSSLTWGKLKKNDNEWFYYKHRQKTKELQSFLIPDHVMSLIGQPGRDNDKVFIGLKYSSYMNVELTKWMLKAGITKPITFHCARHTWATLQLNFGTDITIVSKVLGHKHLKTTMIYAKIMDSNVKKAMNVIPAIDLGEPVKSDKEIMEEKMREFEAKQQKASIKKP